MKIFYQIKPILESNTRNREPQPRQVLPTRRVEKKLSFVAHLAQALEEYK